MYSDYLSYLKHVDDTTSQDFQNELNNLNNEHKKAIQLLKEKHSKLLDAANKNYTAKEQNLKDTISTLEDKHKKAIQQLKEEHSKLLDAANKNYTTKEQSLKEIITDLKRKLALEKARYTKDKNTTALQVSGIQSQLDAVEHKASRYERLYESSQSKLTELSIYRTILVILISFLSLGVIPTIYIIFYLPYSMCIKGPSFSIIRWIQCGQYESERVNR